MEVEVGEETVGVDMLTGPDDADEGYTPDAALHTSGYTALSSSSSLRPAFPATATHMISAQRRHLGTPRGNQADQKLETF